MLFVVMTCAESCELEYLSNTRECIALRAIPPTRCAWRSFRYMRPRSPRNPCYLFLHSSSSATIHFLRSSIARSFILSSSFCPLFHLLLLFLIFFLRIPKMYEQSANDIIPVMCSTPEATVPGGIEESAANAA